MKTITRPSFLKIFLRRGIVLLALFLCVTFIALNLVAEKQRQRNLNQLRYQIQSISADLSCLYEMEDLESPEAQETIKVLNDKMAHLHNNGNTYFATYIGNTKIADTHDTCIVSKVKTDDELVSYSDSMFYEISDLSILPPEMLIDSYRSQYLFNDPCFIVSYLNPGFMKAYIFEYEFQEIYVKEDGTFIPGRIRSVRYSLTDRTQGQVSDFADLTPSDTSGYERIDGPFHTVTSYTAPEHTLTEKDCNYMYGGDLEGTYYKLNDEFVPDSFNRISDLRDKILYFFGLINFSDVQEVNHLPYLQWSVRVAYEDDPSMFVMMPYTCTISIILAVILPLMIALIWSSLKYSREYSVYEIFEYRRKTTEAMAHDLKTPLAAITAAVETLQEGIASDPAPHYDILMTNATTMNRMIEGILGFSRSESGNIRIEPSEVNIREMIDLCLCDYRPLFDASNLTVKVEGSSVLIDTDPKLFRQALENILGNCCAHADPDTEITIAIDPSSLTISNRTSDEITNVKDLKKPFVKGSSSRSSSGTGLGLSIADNNLRMLGCRLDLSLENDVFKAGIDLSSK